MNGTGEFELSLLEAPTAAAPPCAQPAQVDVLTTVEDVQRGTIRVAASAQRLMSIYTPNLEPEIYDHSPFLDVLKRFVLARSFAKVRVLLADGSRLVRDNHRFVAMSRRLSSYIDIRVLSCPSASEPSPAYLIADDRAIVYRANRAVWDGIADLNNPAVAHVHLASFDEQWIASAPEESTYRATRL